MVAFVWVYKAAIFLDKIKPIKIKKNKHKTKNLFKYGLTYLAKVLFSNDLDEFRNCCKFLSCTYIKVL